MNTLAHQALLTDRWALGDDIKFKDDKEWVMRDLERSIYRDRDPRGYPNLPIWDSIREWIDER